MNLFFQQRIMVQEKTLIIKESIDFKPFALNTVRYLKYIEILIEKILGPGMYSYEEIYDGILMFYKDISIYHKIYHPITPQQGKLLKKFIKDSPNFMTKGINSENFPRKGIHMIIESETHPIGEIFEILEPYFKSIHGGITIQVEEAKIITITFNKYEEFMNYAHFMNAMTHFAENNSNLEKLRDL